MVTTVGSHYFFTFAILNTSTGYHVSSIWGQLKSHLRGIHAVDLPEVTWQALIASDVAGRGPDRKWSRAHAQPEVVQYRPSGPFDRKWRHPTSPIVWPLMGSLGCAHAQTEVAQYPPFGAFWPDITSPVGLPLEGWGARMRNLKLSNIRSEVPLWCSLGRLRPISSMATGTNPFTGYLPISRHFIFIITFLTNLFCFRICCVVLQGCLRPIIVF